MMSLHGLLVRAAVSAAFLSSPFYFSLYAQTSPAPSITMATTKLMAREPQSVQVTLDHSYGPQPIDVTLSLGAGLTLHAETLVLEDSAATTHRWRAEANELTWQGVLNDQALHDTFTAAPTFAYAGTSVTELGLAPERIQSLNCEAEPCDETLTTLALDFSFIDTHFDALTLSDNGLIALGDVDLGEVYAPEPLPFHVFETPVFAPFWSDFITQGPNSDILWAPYHDGETAWLIVEWHNVAELLNPSGARYTFAVWFAQGAAEQVSSGHVVFNYIDIPSEPWDGLSVGYASSASAGQAIYANGLGELPQSGDTLLLDYQPAQDAELAFEVAISNHSFGALNPAQTTFEVAPESSVLVLPNAAIKTQSKAAIGVSVHNPNVTGDSSQVESKQLLTLHGKGPVKLASDELKKGSLIMDESQGLMYQANVNDLGEEAFSVYLVDANGWRGAQSTLEIVVVAAATDPEPPTEPPTEPPAEEPPVSVDDGADPVQYRWPKSSVGLWWVLLLVPLWLSSTTIRDKEIKL